ncbi:MAG TPA: N-6 DNA methylase [Nitrospiria bacterium]
MCDLNFAVQRTIDRIIFLRMCEDRGIELYGQLMGLLNGENTYKRLQYIYGLADDRYNSGLFHFKPEKGRAEAPDELTLMLSIDDKVLKDIIRRLYYPESPYEFSVLSADILGNVYEQFLGKVIRLTAGHRAVIEEKPEVKKAGGVYYTPTYIVDYIVKNTVGKIVGADLRVRPDRTDTNNKGTHIGAPLQRMTPKQISKLRILDPACGSGSFLIGAYTYLLDYHRDWYVKDGSEKHTKEIYQGAGGQWFLTTQEKKRILLNNIYGVDIDSQAVEVTKLSLLLKVLEGENQETLNKQLRMWRERALPDLGSNIKCGNSLIGPDYYEDRQTTMFDDEEVQRVNAFDWKAEFPVIMKAGGFDAVIGNPPYVRSITLKESDPVLWDLYRSHYRSASSREWDIYLIFVEKGLSFLKKNGKLGYILPNKFLNSQVGENLRAVLSEGRYLERLIHFGAFQIFRGATNYTCLLFLHRDGKDSADVARYIGPVNNSRIPCPLPEDAPVLWKTSKILAAKLMAGPWEVPSSNGKFLEKLKRWPGLDSIAHVFQGTGTRADSVYLVEFRGRKGNSVRVYSPEKDAEYLLESTFLKPALRGRSIGAYEIAEEELLLIVPYEVINGKSVLVLEKKLASLAPRTLEYLRECKPRLDEREKGRFKGKGWYRYGRPQNLNRFEVSEKIVFPDVANRGACTLDTKGRWLLDTAYAIVVKPNTQCDQRFILAILNSPVLTYFLKETGTALRGGYFRLKTAYLNPFPLRSINFTDPYDKDLHDKMVMLVEQILDLHKRLKAAKTPDDKTRLQRQIDATDKQIDQLVYELYGLTEEEIEIVEEATSR